MFCIHTKLFVLWVPAAAGPQVTKLIIGSRSPFENKVVLHNLYCYCPHQGLWFSSIKFGGPKVQGASSGVDPHFFSRVSFENIATMRSAEPLYFFLFSYFQRLFCTCLPLYGSLFGQFMFCFDKNSS